MQHTLSKTKVDKILFWLRLIWGLSILSLLRQGWSFLSTFSYIFRASNVGYIVNFMLEGVQIWLFIQLVRRLRESITLGAIYSKQDLESMQVLTEWALTMRQAWVSISLIFALFVVRICLNYFFMFF